MRVYRCLAIVPTTGTHPDGVTTFTADPEMVALGMNTAARMGRMLEELSDGKGSMDVTILPLKTPVGPDQYTERSGDPSQYYLNPVRVAQLINMHARFDLFAILADPDAVTMTTFSGISTSRGFCVRLDPITLNAAYIDFICIHEFMHYFENLIRPPKPNGWPECEDSNGISTSIHCGAEYGHGHDNTESWLRAYLTASLPDGSGIQDDKWDVPTPTEKGVYGFPPDERRFPSTFGFQKAVRVDNATVTLQLP